MTSRKLYTLVLIRKDSGVLLGMKKRGFGKGKWNGFGGKVEAGETVHSAALRELHEECGLTTKELHRIGRLDFEFAGQPTIMEVHVFTAHQFEGQPTESEEMSPKWFGVKDIPFNQMWPDDSLWFPLFLKGALFQGYFFFKDMDTIGHHKLNEVENLPNPSTV